MLHIHTRSGQVDHTVEVFIVHRGRVLLRKHDKYGIWLSVGGHVELHEDPNLAAVREAKEEVGLDIVLFNVRQVPVYGEPDYQELIAPVFVNRHRINATHEHVSYTYFATTDSDTVVPERPDDEWRWLTASDIHRGTVELKPHIKHYALSALDALAQA